MVPPPPGSFPKQWSGPTRTYCLQCGALPMDTYALASLLGIFRSHQVSITHLEWMRQFETPARAQLVLICEVPEALFTSSDSPAFLNEIHRFFEEAKPQSANAPAIVAWGPHEAP